MAFVAAAPIFSTGHIALTAAITGLLTPATVIVNVATM